MKTWVTAEEGLDDGQRKNLRDLMRDRYLLLDNRFSTTRAAMQDFVSGKVARKQLRSSIGAATKDPGCLPRARRIYE